MALSDLSTHDLWYEIRASAIAGDDEKLKIDALTHASAILQIAKVLTLRLASQVQDENSETDDSGTRVNQT